MHKWGIPLMWVIGLGLAIPAGAIAYEWYRPEAQTKRCAVYHSTSGSVGDSGYYVILSEVIVAFLLPVVLAIFPFIALLMQLCGGREPRLDPPHNRTAMTCIGLIVVLVAAAAVVVVHCFSLPMTMSVIP